MPRNRSSGRSGGRSGMFSRGAPATKTASRPAPAPAKPQQPQQPAAQPQASMPPAMAPQQSPGLLSGIGSTIVQGMAFGTGSAIAHRAVDAVAGPRTVQHEYVEKGADGSSAPMAAPAAAAAAAVDNEPALCEFENTEFTRCMNDNRGNLGNCQSFFDVLSRCQQDARENARWH